MNGDIGFGVDVFEEPHQTPPNLRECLAGQCSPKDDGDVGITARRAGTPVSTLRRPWTR